MTTAPNKQQFCGVLERAVGIELFDHTIKSCRRRRGFPPRTSNGANWCLKKIDRLLEDFRFQRYIALGKLQRRKAS